MLLLSIKTVVLLQDQIVETPIELLLTFYYQSKLQRVEQGADPDDINLDHARVTINIGILADEQ